jgi:hypothetical protein
MSILLTNGLWRVMEDNEEWFRLCIAVAKSSCQSAVGG